MKRDLIATLFFSAIIMALLATACNSSTAKISGKLAGGDSEDNVKLSVLQSDGTYITDSTAMDSKGRFSFKMNLQDGHARIVNLGYNNESVTLIVAPGDNININALAFNISNYTVEGSKESELVKEINDVIVDGLYRLDSLAKRPESRSTDVEIRKRAVIEYMRELQGIKRSQIKFAMENSKSLAAIYALRQKLPQEEYFINPDIELYYSRMLIDSLETTYPDSPYVKGLRRTIEEADGVENVRNMLNESLAEPKGFPEIELEDMYGNKQMLSSLSGRIIILDFWSVRSEGDSANNADMKQLYERYHKDGLEIYQVNLDEQKADWINTVQRQNLPWINVRALGGFASNAVSGYNVSSLPANYVIDREGTIVGRNIFGDKLEQTIASLIKNNKTPAAP